MEKKHKGSVSVLQTKGLASSAAVAEAFTPAQEIRIKQLVRDVLEEERTDDFDPEGE